MNAKVIDNFLEKEDFDNIKNLLTGPYFPWYKNDSIVDKDYILENNELENIQFIHTLYKNYVPQSEFAEIINPIIKKINPLSIIRIKANLTLGRKDSFNSGYHVDINDKRVTTAIFYINTTNGKTFFEDGNSIECVENRIVMFNSQMRHSGSSCTDKKYRCVLNFNYIESVKG